MSFYKHSNENLKAIIAGLDLSSEDEVIAVGGSGDQAFALLEFAGKVKVFDTEPEQLSYIKERSVALQNYDRTNFLKANEWQQHYYFLEEKDRLEKIRDKLKNLTVAEPGDILELAQREERYSRIYMSNVIGYQERLNNRNPRIDDIRRNLQNVTKKLDVGGLVYVSNHKTFARAANNNEQVPSGKDLFFVQFLPSELDLSAVLSSIARVHDKSWDPAVYRKIRR